MAAEECMACRTAAGDYAADEVYRDERVVAVVAQHAINPGHVVVVPIEHVRNALTMDEELLAHMNIVAVRLAKRLRECLGGGIMLCFNNEPPCQSLFHAHLHVVPRYDGDAMDQLFGGPVPAEERARMAAIVRGAQV